MAMTMATACLVEMGLVLSDFARRPLDMASRLGGEEFAVVLYDCSRADGLRRLEELRRQIESLDLAQRRHRTGSRHDQRRRHRRARRRALAEAYRLADTVLYAAKHQGRNRTVIAESISKPAARAA